MSGFLSGLQYGVALFPAPSSSWGEGPGDEATSYPAHMERAFSCGENLENEATVYLFFSFAPCGSKERESGYRLEIFIDENPSMIFYLSHCRGIYCPSILITS